MAEAQPANNNLPWDISPQGFVLLELLGKGSFGEVYKAYHRLDHVPCAIKVENVLDAILKRRGIAKDQASFLENFHKEIKCLGKINSSFVVRYLSNWTEGQGSEHFQLDEINQLLGLNCNVGDNESGIEESSSSCKSYSSSKNLFPDLSFQKQDTFIFIQMELCNYKSLRQFLDDASEPELRLEYQRIINQTAKGLAAIHAQGIIHKDIKPANIYSTKINGRDPIIWKIGDLGLSKLAEDDELSNTFEGTPIYMAPEVIKNKKLPCSFKIDIYSLGLTYLCILYKFKSDRDRHNYFSRLCKGLKPLSSLHSQQIIIQDRIERQKYIGMVEKMLNKNPDFRPTAEEIYQTTTKPLHFYRNGNELADSSKFVGRKCELKKLNNFFTQQTQQLIVVSDFEKYSSFGMGKSALVQKYLSSLQNYSTIWLEGSTEYLFEAQLFNLCAELDIPTRQPGPVIFLREMREIVEDLCKTLENNSSIVIVDDFNENQVETIKTFLNHGLFVIATTSDMTIIPQFELLEETVINLKGLETKDATTLLEKELGQVENQKVYSKLTKLLYNNPSALANAVKVLRIWVQEKGMELKWAIELYIRKVFTKSQQVKHSNDSKIVDYIENSSYNAVMLATISQLIDCLLKYRNQNKIPQTILNFLFLIYPSPVSVDRNIFPNLLKNATSKEISDGIKQLKEFGILITENENKGDMISLTFHAFLFLQTPTDKEEQLDQLLSIYQSLMPLKHASWIPNIYALFDKSVKYPNLLKKFAGFMLDFVPILKDNSYNLFDYIKGKLKPFQRHLGPGHESALALRNWYGLTLREEGKFNRSLKVYSKLDKICSKKFPPTHWLNIDICLNLGLLDHTNRNYKSAKDRFESLLNLKIEDQNVLMKIKSYYVITLNELEEIDKTIAIEQEILKFCLDSYGDQKEDTISAKLNVAIHLYQVERYREALELFKDVLKFRTRFLGEEHTDTLEAKTWLASTIGNIDETQKENVLRVLEHVLSCHQRGCGPNHPTTIKHKEQLASVYLEHGEFLKAEKMFKEVLEANYKRFGQHHPKILGTKSHLAEIAVNMEDYEMALEIYQEVWTKQKEYLYFEENHPTVLETRHEIGEVLYKQKKFEQAKSVFEQLRILRGQVLGEENRNALNSRFWFAKCLRKCGDTGRAKKEMEYILRFEEEYELEEFIEIVRKKLEKLQQL